MTSYLSQAKLPSSTAAVTTCQVLTGIPRAVTMSHQTKRLSKHKCISTFILLLHCINQCLGTCKHPLLLFSCILLLYFCSMRLALIGLHTDHKGVGGYYWYNLLGAECRDVGLAWRECTKMSLRGLVLWEAVMEWLGQMLCICGSFTKICQRSPTDWEKYLPSSEYWVIMMMNNFCGMVDQQKVFSFISSRDN